MKIRISEMAGKAWEYTKPRPTTASNFDQPRLFQAASEAAIEGFYLLGVAGAVTNTAAAVVGLKTQTKFGKLSGALAGAATGAALAAVSGHFLGASSVGLAAAFGGLCGTYSTLRGHQQSKFRDAGAYGLVFGSPLMTGPAKASLGLAAVLGAEFDNDGARALVSGAVGAAAGVAFSMLGYCALSPVTAALACGGMGIFGSVVGPRAAMVMRNLSEDIGHKIAKPKDPAEPEKEKSLFSRTIGILPMAALRQSVTAFTMGKFEPTSLAIGFGLDATMSAYEVYLNKAAEANNKPQPPPTP